MKEYRNSNQQQSLLTTDDVLLIFAATAIELHVIQNKKLIFFTILQKSNFLNLLNHTLACIFRKKGKTKL